MHDSEIGCVHTEYLGDVVSLLKRNNMNAFNELLGIQTSAAEESQDKGASSVVIYSNRVTVNGESNPSTVPPAVVTFLKEFAMA